MSKNETERVLHNVLYNHVHVLRCLVYMISVKACCTHCCYSYWWTWWWAESHPNPRSPYHHPGSIRPGWPAGNCGCESESRLVWEGPGPPLPESPAERKPRWPCNPAPPENTRAGSDDPCDDRCPSTSARERGWDAAGALVWIEALLCGRGDVMGLTSEAGSGIYDLVVIKDQKQF